MNILNINENNKNLDDIVYELIKAVYNSKANLCIVPIQDLICLSSEARINTPSTLGGNWRWRLKQSELNDKLSEIIKKAHLHACVI